MAEMTHTDSKYLFDAAGQTRTEEQARRDRRLRKVRQHADRNGLCLMADEAETSLQTAFSLRDAIMGAGK